MASLNINIGCEFFRRIREENLCYVDKTSLIEELLSSDQAQVSLITRPRRFGKTLTMTMLQEFFDIQRDSRRIFEGLAISGNTALCEKWMNRYPTVFLSLKGVEGLDYDFALSRLSDLLQQTCIEHVYLLESEKVDIDIKEKLEALKKGGVGDKGLAGSLQLLSRALRAYWGKPAILLIDEYDVPVSCAEQNGYYKEMVSFMRVFLGAALKTNASLKFAVLTGCLRIAKESIFTGLNNFRCYTVSDIDYADKLGFTEKEVDGLLEAAGLSDKKGVFKEWYDGYRFGEGAEIYCPWDILMYLSDLQKSAEAKPKAYWNNTSGNAIVRTLINMAGREIKEKIEKLIAGEAIEERLAEELTYDIVYKNERNIWTMLYLTGYLTKALIQPDNGLTALVIPNKEVKLIFTDTVSLWLEDKIAEDDLAPFVQALWSGGCAVLQSKINDILYETISYFDSRENYYHGFMTGLLRGAGLAVRSNREQGLGRADIIIEDGRNKRGVIIELKHAQEYEELEAKAEEGLRQIEERNYAAGLGPHIRRVMNYGVSFWKKESCVKASETAR